MIQNALPRRVNVLPDDLLDSWKAIAAHLKRDVRTVQRWERTRGLPVHRLPGERAAVYSSRSEITAWLQRRPATANAREDRAGKIKIAVLPVDNLTGDPAEDCFSDGFTDELITQIATRAPNRIGVIARTSAMRYKGARKTVAEIGQQLGVHYVLEGSVRRSEGCMRISVQLVQVADETHVWARSFDRDVHDVLGLQAEVAATVARETCALLLRTERERAA